jgi:predicted anti-sigma-YlaC factor YlaD
MMYIGGKKKRPALLVFSVLFLFLSGCSIEKMALRKVADMMSGEEGASVFTGDEDLELIEDAMPFALKLYEIMLEQEPEHTGLLLTAGKGFIGYANVFVHTPMEMLSYEEYEKEKALRKRAKMMYLRGRDYVLRALEVRHPGSIDVLSGNFADPAVREKLSVLLAEMGKEDAPYLYYAGAGWFGAVGMDVFDMDLTLDVPKAVAMIDRAYELEPDYGNGLIHEFYISYYASIPPGMVEGSEEKARFHFTRAVELSGGKNPAPYVALATTLSIQKQNAKEFIELLDAALEIRPEDDPDNKMIIVQNRRRAAWYLSRIEDYFLLDSGISEEY